MIDISEFLDTFTQLLDATFPERVWFIGLQGSYGRGEATQNSDIDVVVILDELSSGDIYSYNAMLEMLPHREYICGFISGKDEMLHWESSEIFQFYYDTKPIKGNLDELLPLINDDAICRAIKIGVCSIYHSCVHNMLYKKNGEILRDLYKSASFVIQAIAFRQFGKYFSLQSELMQVVSNEEKRILETFANLKNGAAVDFNMMSNALFDWTKVWINSKTLKITL